MNTKCTTSPFSNAQRESHSAQNTAHSHYLPKRVKPPARATEQPHALRFGLAFEAFGTRAVAPPPKVVCAQITPLAV